MNNNQRKQYRQARIRKKIRGTGEMPRLSVHRSNVAINGQIIDDSTHTTLLGITQKKVASVQKGSKIEKARIVGMELAKQALAKNISKVVFDKGSYAYHGRVKAFAEGAREGGLQF